jgi:DNA helicase-2/ATP-dependent DNA helicase PcrA
MTAKPAVTGKELNPKVKSAEAPEAPLDAHSIDNIARFFGGKAGAGKPGSLPRPAIDLPQPKGATGLRKGQHVRHAKYGEGTILLREGEGEDAKLTVLFARHGMKKLMEKFANLQKI